MRYIIKVINNIAISKYMSGKEILSDSEFVVEKDMFNQFALPSLVNIENNKISYINDVNIEDISTPVDDIKYSESDINFIRLSNTRKIKSECEKCIYDGFDADVINRGILHYSLSNTKQDDLKVLMQSVLSGAEFVLWRDDSRVTHEIYTASQFSKLYKIGYSYIISCKIRSDWLEQYLNDLLDSGEYDKAIRVSWDTELPQEYIDNMNNQILSMTQ